MMTNPVESGCKGLHYMIENPYIYIYIYISRWWFHLFFMFIPKWKNDPIWLMTHIFQMGWTHHLDCNPFLGISWNHFYFLAFSMAVYQVCHGSSVSQASLKRAEKCWCEKNMTISLRLSPWVVGFWSVNHKEATHTRNNRFESLTTSIVCPYFCWWL